MPHEADTSTSTSSSSDSSSEVLLCGPERTIGVPFVLLSAALLHQQHHQLVELLALLEARAHALHGAEARVLSAAMLLARPRLSAEERAVLAAAGPQLLADLLPREQQLLDALVRLLLAARFQPLTASEWRQAEQHAFTFDVPVVVDWDAADPSLLAPFWARRRQCGSGSSVRTSSSSASVTIDEGDAQSPLPAAANEDGFQHPWLLHDNTPGAEHAAAGSSFWPTAAAAAAAAALLPPRHTLPAWSDRALVFHRGVGVATAPGLFLSQKSDLLLGYLLLQPAAALRSRATAAVARVLPELQPPAQPKGDDDHHRQQDHSAAAAGQALGDSGAAASTTLGAGGVETAASGLSRQQLAGGGTQQQPGRVAPLRVLERQSLRSLMPDAASVLKRFWEPLVLSEPTLRNVVVLYRQSSPDGISSSTGGAARRRKKPRRAAASAARKAASSAVTAALHAGAGDLLAAGASAVAAAGAAAADEVPGARPAAATVSKTAHAAGRALTSQRHALASARRAKAAVALTHNSANICVRSFADVAVADLELVLPAKQVTVQPTTLVRAALLAVGALGALAALLQQGAALHWQPSLAVALAPACGLAAGRALRLLTTIRAHQAQLSSTMVGLAYEAARDSQEGVVATLLAELRDETAKEAALVVAALHTRLWTDAAAPGGGSSDDATTYTQQQLEAACEAWLQESFGLDDVYLELGDTLARLTAWGVVAARPDGGFAAEPLEAALPRLRAASHEGWEGREGSAAPRPPPLPRGVAAHCCSRTQPADALMPVRRQHMRGVGGGSRRRAQPYRTTRLAAAAAASAVMRGSCVLAAR